MWLAKSDRLPFHLGKNELGWLLIQQVSGLRNVAYKTLKMEPIQPWDNSGYDHIGKKIERMLMPSYGN